MVSFPLLLECSPVEEDGPLSHKAIEHDIASGYKMYITIHFSAEYNSLQHIQIFRCCRMYIQCIYSRLDPKTMDKVFGKVQIKVRVLWQCAIF